MITVIFLKTKKFDFPKDANEMANTAVPEQSAPFGAVWPQGYKAFFMLNSAQHEIFPAHKY